MSEERKAGERLLFKCTAFIIGALLAWWLLPKIWDKLSPFILAIPLAAMLQPVILFCEKKLKMKRSLASVILVILTIAVGIAVLTFFLSFVIDQMTDLVNHSGDIVRDTVSAIRSLTNSILESAVNISPDSEKWVRGAMDNMIGRVTELGPAAAEALLAWLVNLATSMPYMVIYVSFLAMALYFVTKDYDNIRAVLPGGRLRRQDSTSTQLTNSAVRNLSAYLKVQGVFALIVLLVSWPYLALFGYPYAAVLAMAAGIMEMIPMIGSGLLYIVLSIIYFLGGDTAIGWQLLGLTLGLQLLRRLLEPKLVSNAMSITPLESLIGMFVGMKMGGVIGLIGGPVAMAVLVGAIRGRIFEGVKQDFRTVAAYFRRRWKPAEENKEEQNQEKEALP
jgi:sporulation integral membrane protein YtvI